MTGILDARNSLVRGEIIACPTEAVYGLSCDPNNLSALKKLLLLKKRQRAKGFILVASHIDQLLPFLTPISDDIMRRIMPTWPGPCTWVLPAKSSVSRYLRGDFDTLAVRITQFPRLGALCDAFDGAIVSTSANEAGEPPCTIYNEVKGIFADKIEVIVKGEVGQLGQPTSIFDGRTGKQLR